MATLPDEAVKLEAMRKEDSSWHPSVVSLSSDTSTGVGLIVSFGSQDPEDIIFTEEEALRRIRFRSIPLRGDDCTHIKEGEPVLAAHRTRFRSLFFDAKVEKACRVRHSKKVYCRCTFEIKWLPPQFKGEIATVSSSAIMRLDRNSIDTYPAVAAFLNSVKAKNGSGASTFLSLFEDMNCDMNLDGLLEKQMEEINHLVGMSKKGCPEEILLGHERDYPRGSIQCKFVTESHLNFQDVQVPHDLKNLRRSTRSQSKLKIEIEGNNSSLVQSIPVDAFGNRSHLSPLAARAALASLVYQLPQKPLSVSCMEKEDFTNVSEKTPEKHVNMVSMNVNNVVINPDVCIIENVSMAGGFSDVEARADRVIPKPAKNVRLPNSGRRNGLNKPQMEEFPGMLTKQVKHGYVLDDLEESLTCKVSARKLNFHVNMTRLTRSGIHEVMGDSNKVEVKSSADDMKSSSPATTKRLTRSTIEKEKGNLTMKVKQDLQNGKPTQYEQPDSTEIPVKRKIGETTKKKSCSSPIDTELDLSLVQDSKKQRRCSAIVTTKRDEGKLSTDTGGQQDEKKKPTYSKKKPDLRFSHRLRFLPRTRSQVKNRAD
ncbi:PREDICTED: uncharacterized protein LOC104599208 [Nelumbo nucifera]|uniref:Uncharacterized protein LOC104599208 n=2 Tax=Nelumbo nucifera TaxID=4432 RepID=A0A1U8A520_NELNU|nr:PREDICTED: uncharacterized protein LOC104599208 [Nelumbo nucifera]XP_010259953.1 PREDICTED: uncharacterized protein LOC104599208 [Nelumbo nucifera]DAD27768.1 TPA_asm: hypothetical protein HUJ06_029236 [Nelumbo nucifera]